MNEIGSEIKDFRKALERDHPFHILSFYWDDFRPSLTAYDLREREIVEMDLTKLDWRVTGRRICTGMFSDAGYRPCPAQRPVSRFSQCSKCSFIPDLECIFDPKCSGDYCETEFCSRDHAIYLAFFGSMVKVGMTGAHRIRERLIEQGADAFAVLAQADNRWAARGLEKKIAGELGLKQAIMGKTALGLMNETDSPVGAAKRAFEEFVARTDREVLEGCAGRFLESLTPEQQKKYVPDRDLFDFGNSLKAFVPLADYPIDLPLDVVPHLCSIVGVHSGEVVGLKGKFLVYRDAGDEELRALQMPALGARVLWG